ncbi:MAG: STAS domain-containing protein [Candidatus Electrothrix aestuarii]|uniref:Anti-sigma factor antagonist n=1 Tax=Candidatus Electrothrix aestuarii TaxID=3062594 RepID=A0AAU8LVM2_9BACT|nr:STAS domain-containing protein [Candidatus Electrothrix aestuarii]
MSLKTILEMTAGGVAKIQLKGKLDAGTADDFQERIEEAAGHKAQRIALLLEGLTFMASAGLRTLIFAKQKMGATVDIYVIGAQTQVIETLEMTGLNHSVVIRDIYDPAEIEKV